METVKKTPIKKKETIIAEYKAKRARMIRGQFQTFGIKGAKEIKLTYIENGRKFQKLAKHGDIFEIPFGYVKYLNEHGQIRRAKKTGLKYMDSDGNVKPVRDEDNEQRYFFRILSILSPEDMAELDPSTSKVVSTDNY